MDNVAGKHVRRQLPLPLLLTIVIGAAVTLVAFLVFLGQENARLRADFQNLAGDRAQAVRAALAEDAVELELIADYVASSAELGRGELGPFVREFGRLVRHIPLREEDTQVVAFISSLPAEERASFEALMRKNIDPGFTLREAGPEGLLRAAGSRPLYYPVTNMEPVEYSGSVLGLDAASVPQLRTAIEHAVASGKLTTSAAVNLPLSASGAPVVWSFMAVYRGAYSSAPQTTRTGLMGLCSLAFRVDQLVELSLKDLSPAGIDLELLDPAAPQGQRSLYYHHSRAPGYVASSVLKTGMTFRTPIDAGERQWTFVAYPTTRFIAQHRSWQSWTILGGGLLLTALSAFILLARLRRTRQIEAQVGERTQELADEISKHESLERVIAESRTTLTAQVAQLNAKNQQIQLLNEAGDALQSCLTADEAYATVSRHAPRLLPGTAGTLFINDPLKGLFFPVAPWGEPAVGDPAFKAEDCWALRRGKPHEVSRSSANLPCPHAEGSPQGPSLCIPLAAIGKTIGLLHVRGDIEQVGAFAASVAEHIGLALSNLMLRSDLRQLSIHDPLTGLYNRRYMEETLETELRRAERKEHPIGIIMIDIDHFKAFNDGFGHAAGDQMLRAIGSLVQTNLRAGDIACRYGGEELVLILPEAGVEAAAHRAEDLRTRAKSLDVKHLEKPLGPVTISLGVAVYPGNGRTRDELFAAADASLYKAKQEGRDRVVVAEGVGSVKVPEG
jgi:diguanylate cyclase (GGDEF)-like protein